jgi:hypothetical protein
MATDSVFSTITSTWRRWLVGRLGKLLQNVGGSGGGGAVLITGTSWQVTATASIQGNNGGAGGAFAMPGPLLAVAVAVAQMRRRWNGSACRQVMVVQELHSYFRFICNLRRWRWWW